ncbi:MAG: tetratricopeptide repeat protein [Microcystaceae cyanobacterium]
MSKDSLTLFQSKLQAGKQALDRGQYRLSVEELEAAIALVNLGSKQGGEAQLWLVMAYQAAGRLAEAQSLCRKLIHHPDPELKKQGKQVLYILQAPSLSRPKEWMTEIPDLTQPDAHRPSYVRAKGSPPKPKETSPIVFEDTRRMNTKDNGFIGAAIALILLLLAGTLWLT